MVLCEMFCEEVGIQSSQLIRNMFLEKIHISCTLFIALLALYAILGPVTPELYFAPLFCS